MTTIPQIGLHYSIVRIDEYEDEYSATRTKETIECTNALVIAADEEQFTYVPPICRNRNAGCNLHYAGKGWRISLQRITEDIASKLPVKESGAIYICLWKHKLISQTHQDGFIYALSNLKYGCDYIDLYSPACKYAHARLFNGKTGWYLTAGRDISKEQLSQLSEANKDLRVLWNSFNMHETTANVD